MAGPGSGEMKEDVLLFVSQPSNFTHARSAGRNGCRLTKKERGVANDDASKRDNFPQRRRALKNAFRPVSCSPLPHRSDALPSLLQAMFSVAAEEQKMTIRR